jgi:hypothetical protein
LLFRSQGYQQLSSWRSSFQHTMSWNWNNPFLPPRNHRVIVPLTSTKPFMIFNLVFSGLVWSLGHSPTVHRQWAKFNSAPWLFYFFLWKILITNLLSTPWQAHACLFKVLSLSDNRSNTAVSGETCTYGKKRKTAVSSRVNKFYRNSTDSAPTEFQKRWFHCSQIRNIKK